MHFVFDMFNLSHRIIRAGEVLEITWASPDADQVELLIRTGEKQSVLPVEQAGVKRIRLKNADGKTVTSLRTYKQGKVKIQNKRIWVRPAKEEKLDEFEYVDGGNFFVRQWRTWKNDILSSWRFFSPDKKQLYWVYLLLLAYVVILPFYPTASVYVIYGIILYLFWVLFLRK